MTKPAPLALDPQELQEQLDANLKQEQWQRYRCTLVTPMYGGGVKAGEVDAAMPIRATEIRGHLRFWWRLLNQKNFADSQKLFEAEREIWGGLGDEKTLAASKVSVMISKQPGAQTTASKSEANAAIKYVFGQGESHWLKAAQKFEMKMKYPKELAVQVEAAVQWWATFGGLGAKTRRGFGAVQIEDIAPVSDNCLKAAGCLIARAETTADPVTAWQKANEKLHKFRQGRGFARAQGKEKPSRSFWPEPDQLRRDFKMDDGGRHVPEHQAGNVFGRAAFGLPIIFDFRKNTEPGKTELLPEGNNDRMASPLILRPCVYNGRWTATALLLPYWKEALHQPLRYKSGMGTPKAWPVDEKEQQRIAETIAPMNVDGKLRGLNPLSAFMAFFSEHESKDVGQIATAVKVEEKCEGARITFEKNGSVYAKTSNKMFSASGEAAVAIKASLSKVAHQKIASGFYKATAIVKGSELLAVEEAK